MFNAPPDIKIDHFGGGKLHLLDKNSRKCFLDLHFPLFQMLNYNVITHTHTHTHTFISPISPVQAQ